MFRIVTIFFLVCTHSLYSQSFWDKSLPPFNNIQSSIDTSVSFDSQDMTYVPQIFISSFFLKRKDSDATFQYSNPVDNISFGFALYNNTVQKRIYEINRVILGLTFEDSKTDFRKDYLEPVNDSILVSNSQVFLRVYNKAGYFVSCRIPLDYQIKDNENNNINVDYVRVGIGRTLDINKSFNLDFHYNLLLYPNKDGFRKGFLTFGVSKIFNIKLK